MAFVSIESSVPAGRRPEPRRAPTDPAAEPRPGAAAASSPHPVALWVLQGWGWGGGHGEEGQAQGWRSPAPLPRDSAPLASPPALQPPAARGGASVEARLLNPFAQPSSPLAVVAWGPRPSVTPPDPSHHPRGAARDSTPPSPAPCPRGLPPPLTPPDGIRHAGKAGSPSRSRRDASQRPPAQRRGPRRWCPHRPSRSSHGSSHARPGGSVTPRTRRPCQRVSCSSRHHGPLPPAGRRGRAVALPPLPGPGGCGSAPR